MKDRVEKVLYDINKDIIEYDGKTMLEDGIIDSFEIIEIVARLEEEFNIEIDADYIVLDNFKNKASIELLIEKIIKRV